MTKGERIVMQGLIRRLAAKDKLLVAYRLGGRPPEAAFEEIEATEDVVAHARRLLASKTNTGNNPATPPDPSEET